MITSNQFVFALAAVLVALYVVHCLVLRTKDTDDTEYFDEPPPADAQPEQLDTAPAFYDLQTAINLSDVTVSEKQRTDYRELQENAKQIPSVDDRFQAAKRKTEEHGRARPGGRARPTASSRGSSPTRSGGSSSRPWSAVPPVAGAPDRGEPSFPLGPRPHPGAVIDSLRGDVVPKNLDSAMGMMRVGRSDPSVDLHPGALGPMPGGAHRVVHPGGEREVWRVGVRRGSAGQRL